VPVQRTEPDRTQHRAHQAGDRPETRPRRSSPARPARQKEQRWQTESTWCPRTGEAAHHQEDIEYLRTLPSSHEAIQQSLDSLGPSSRTAEAGRELSCNGDSVTSNRLTITRTSPTT